MTRKTNQSRKISGDHETEKKVKEGFSLLQIYFPLQVNHYPYFFNLLNIKIFRLKVEYALYCKRKKEKKKEKKKG